MDIAEISHLLPPDVAPGAALAIVIISFATAALTAAFGLGGGLTLLAAMSALLPPVAVIPVHGAAQLTANFSRALFLRQSIRWTVIGWFIGGAAIGAAIGARVALSLPPAILQVGVAVFILVSVWAPKAVLPPPGRGAFFIGGAVSNFLTMFFGATGPIVASLLAATRFDRMQIVGTHAGAMVAQHGIKSVAFGAFGFAFAPWAPLIIAIATAGFGGSWVGTILLRKTPEHKFQLLFKVVLSAIAIYLLSAAILGR